MKKFTLLLLLAFMISGGVSAQEKSVVRLNLSFLRTNEEAPVLRCDAKSKNGKKYEPVENASVNIYFSEESDDHLIGKVETDAKGVARLTLSGAFLAAVDTSATSHFIATLAGTETHKAASAELDVTRARITLELKEKDSVRTMTTTLSEWASGTWKPVGETEMKFFVKTTFSDLPVGDDAYITDSEGTITAPFEITLPGDEEGSLNVGSKIEDHELYGTLYAVQKVKWGIPAVQDNSFYKRTLWASRDKTPWWLLVGPNLIIAAVWGSIFYLFFLLLRIRKSGLQN